MAVARPQPSPKEKTRWADFKQSTRARVLGVAMSAAPLMMPAPSEQAPVTSVDEPKFGEEGFGDIEKALEKAPTEGAAGEREPTAAQADSTQAVQARQRGDLIRAQATQRQQARVSAAQAEEAAQKEGGNVVNTTVDAAANMLAYELPVLGHLFWFNVKMIVGSWIQNGHGKFIGPLTWSDIALILNPGGKATGADVAGKSVSSMIPDIALIILLIVVDLICLVLVTINLVFVFLLFYFLARFATDPIGAATEFGDMFGSLFGSLF